MEETDKLIKYLSENKTPDKTIYCNSMIGLFLTHPEMGYVNNPELFPKINTVNYQESDLIIIDTWDPDDVIIAYTRENRKLIKKFEKGRIK